MNNFHSITGVASMAWPAQRALCAILLMAGLLLAGCNRNSPDEPARPGQALASVNGEEITVLQLNEEIQRAGVPAMQQERARKQLLQALIDRTLLESEAAKRDLDRDPKVMQAVARARSLIIAQAYMQQRIGEAGRPSQAEVDAYFKAHPQFFASRRQFAMDQLIMPASAVTPALRTTFDRSSSLDDVTQFLDARQIGYGRAQVTRSTADLKPEVAAKLLAMPKGQLFYVQEGPRALLTALTGVRAAPVSLVIAAPQITEYLATRKSRELAQAEIGRLRATADIAYLNKDLAPDAATPGGKPAAVASLAGGPGAPRVAGAGPLATEATASGSGAVTATRAEAGMETRAEMGAETVANESNADKAALERGVAGLR
ncbi:EpsD family peptidyl-prolyl cis-trans isomerase [Massilia aurea]|uniref:EpsD family peptidyl-prolyl cis-trans isomerase n=1 Tax=Massilia aurea TaxID=373040 RepID=UPI0034620619